MAAAWSLPVSIVVFVIGAAVIGGRRRSARAPDRRLADRTGLGEAFFGMALLGAITSLSGLVLSITATLEELPEFAVSNTVAGIAVQKSSGLSAAALGCANTLMLPAFARHALHSEVGAARCVAASWRPCVSRIGPRRGSVSKGVG